MSQITTFFPTGSGPGSGTVTSVTGGVGINITGVPTVNPTVNLDVPVTIAHGGTNTISFANTDGVIYYTGTALSSTTVGTAGQVLTSNGAGMAPSFQAAGSSGITTINGDVGSVTGPTVTLTGGTSGAVFTGVGTTMTESFNFLSLPDTNAGGTIGYIAFGGNKYIHDFGTFNTFIGQQAGNFTLAGAVGNVGVGYLALGALTTGGFNVAMGIGALSALDQGVNNVAIGTTAMQTGDDASNSVAIGYQALQNLDAADDNIAVGANSMVGNLNSPGNIAIGNLAINTMTTGNGFNIGIGHNCLDILDSGESNIAIGTGAGEAYDTTESSNIVISNVGTATDNNTIRIGTAGSGVGQQNRCFIAGIASVTTSNSEMVTIDTTTGELGSATIPTTSVVAYTGITNADSPYTVLTSDYFIGADVSGGAISVLLPNAPATGSVWIVKDTAGLAAGTNITVGTVGGVVNIDGATSFVMNSAYEAASFIFNGSAYEVF